MVEYHDIVPIWRVRRVDQLPLWVTFLTCLLWKLEYGIIIGAGVNICILLYGVARPKVNVTTICDKVSLFQNLVLDFKDIIIHISFFCLYFFMFVGEFYFKHYLCYV